MFTTNESVTGFHPFPAPLHREHVSFRRGSKAVGSLVGQFRSKSLDEDGVLLAICSKRSDSYRDRTDQFWGGSALDRPFDKTQCRAETRVKLSVYDH